MEQNMDLCVYRADIKKIRTGENHIFLNRVTAHPGNCQYIYLIILTLHPKHL